MNINFGTDVGGAVRTGASFGGLFQRISMESSDGTGTPFAPSSPGQSTTYALLDSSNNILVSSSGDVLTYYETSGTLS